MNAQEHIESIKNRYLKADREFALFSLNRSIDRIGKAFPRYGSFIMEFIQNADDVGSNSLLIEIEDKLVNILNDGRVFSEKDVNSICRVGISSKTSKDYIGYLGVGFKSVFLISESPQIYSGDYRFKFDKNSWPNPNDIPWQIIPLWIEGSVPIPSPYKTLFKIPIINENVLQKLQQEITPEYITNRMLLFLRNLKGIEIRDKLQGFTRMIKKFLHKQTENYEIYLIQEYHDKELKSEEYWLVFRSVCEVPPEVKKDEVTKDWDRGEVDKREVVVAFKLDKEENLIIEEKGTAHTGVFSFLPLKEVPSGLNFLIQADFLTTLGKSEMIRDCLWNEWLAKEIYKLIIEKCIPALKENEKWRFNFVKILYCQWGGHPLFEDNIKAPLRKYLESEPCLISSDGSFIRPDEAVRISQEIMDVVTESDLKRLYPGRKIIHPNHSDLPGGIEQHFAEEPVFNSYRFSDKMQELLSIKAQEKDTKFFIKFYHKYLLPYKDSDRSTLNKLKARDIILTEDYNLTNASSVYIKPKELTIPESLRGSLKIVHMDIASDNEILKMLKLLGVGELTEEHIQNLLKTKEIPTIAQKWETLSSEEKIEKVKLYEKLCKEGQINVADLSFLTLKTKSGKWLKPEEIIFSKEYHPNHRIEELIEKGLLDLPVELLSDVFVQNIGEEEIFEWRGFFERLGVDKKLQDRNFKKEIISRIGIKTAIKFEETEGRFARELPRSEEIGGYDISSLEEAEGGFGLIQSQERYIEVKASAKTNPDISLTNRQLKTLQEKREKYFVYVVRDALRVPTLCPIPGNKLLDIERKIVIPFSEWKNVIEKEFQP